MTYNFNIIHEDDGLLLKALGVSRVHYIESSNTLEFCRAHGNEHFQLRVKPKVRASSPTQTVSVYNAFTDNLIQVYEIIER